MLTLITGTPGSGKTAYGIDYMLMERKDVRKLFVHGVADLKIPHVKIICDSPTCEICPFIDDFDVKKGILISNLFDEVPDNSVVFLDECQHCYRPSRSQSSDLTDDLKLYETHRHRGLDFYFLTQHPSFFHVHLRRLVSKHIHLYGTFISRRQVEFSEVCIDPFKNRSSGVITNYKLQKSVFSLYKSATKHTKLSRKFPYKIFFMIFVLLSLLLFSLPRLYDIFLKKKYEPQKVENSVIPLVPDSVNKDTDVVSDINFLPSSYDFDPLDFYRPETAPAYHFLHSVNSFPILSACVLSEITKNCKCYDQQGIIYQTSDDSCADYVYNGRFDPYLSSDGIDFDISDNSDPLDF